MSRRLYTVTQLAAHYGVSQPVMTRRIRTLGLAPVARDGAAKLFDRAALKALAPKARGRPRSETQP